MRTKNLSTRYVYRRHSIRRMSGQTVPHTPVLALTVMLALAYPEVALGDDERAKRLYSGAPFSIPGSSPSLPTVFDGVLGVVGDRANAAVARIQIELERREAPADGQSSVAVSVKLNDTDGALLTREALITVETDGGQILADDAPAAFLGSKERELDRVTSGTQIKVEHGQARFRLLAPTTPKAVTVRVTAGAATADSVVDFLPELRPLIAVGLIEGVIGRRSVMAGDQAPERFNDGFEQTLMRWSRSFNRGKANMSARTAFFVKGMVSGKTLLTAAFDSDKETRARLMRDIDPEAFYPVYGDQSVTGFDARSSERLYVRLDHDKSYLLYGDFATGDGFSQKTGGGAVASVQQRMLGQYNRSATGVRAHYEKGPLLGNVFATYDSLKQVIEEYPANGTSGPFAVKNNAAIQNSEKVEILVRDKNQLGIIKRVTKLVRFEDYSFEPFSGRILFKQAIPSLTPEGDPQSIRISYEVDQGGDQYWVLGADGQVKLNKAVTVGASAVEDKNPLSPYRLYSANVGVLLGEKTTLVAEVAHTISTTYRVGERVYATPSHQTGELSERAGGNAARIELRHQGERVDASAYWRRSDTGFNNTAADISGGRGEAGVKAGVKVSEKVKVFGEALRTEDRATAAHRDAVRGGVALTLSERLTVDVSLQHAKETAGLKSTAGIAPNTAPLGTGLNPTGGFFGGSAPNTTIDPITGAVVNTFAPITSTAGVANLTPLDATTVRVGARYKITDPLTLVGDVEQGIDHHSQHRYGLGATYQVAERTRLYGRYETQTGLASIYSLNPADRSSSFIAGIENTYQPDSRVFSEFRLNNAQSDQQAHAREVQQASGVRHTWHMREGVAVQAGAEYLHILSGSKQKALALTSGIDYAPDPLWRASAKLEYRRLFDNQTAVGNQSQDQWLNTIMIARQLNPDWTLLARNYLLYTQNRDNAQGEAIGNTLQNRAQMGLAWRPVNHNRVNGLARYEYKTVKDLAQTDGENYRAHILSTHLDYHPSRPWWMTGRLAAKLNIDDTLPPGQRQYSAWLLGGRVVYDITEHWDLGVLTALIFSPRDNARQWAQGIEVGRLLAKNLWLSAGYNWSGFNDRDLSGADYTARGPYLRLRFKFDETLLSRR